MVVFTCGHCGESVQKPKVEKHYQTKCRNRNPNLSCMDCFKDFLGEAYEAHTKCITEEERYSAKGFQAKEKKGEKKQNTWVEMLQSVLDEEPNAPKNVLRIIETVSKHNNTPRKKPKFINFVKNVCGHKTNSKDIDQAWDLIAVKLSALSLANTQNKNQNKKGDENSEANIKDDDKQDDRSNDEKEKGVSIEKYDDIAEEEENIAEEEKNIADGKNEEVSNKKLSKKQRKEEKKRKKYEAELQSAETAPAEEEELPEQPTKKGKKKKTKSECSNGDTEETQQDSKNKNKKRKRQDTANSLPEVQDNIAEAEPVAVTTKVSKKKLKVQENEELEDSVCLHDQNVAKIEELTMNSDQFNWHAVIRSVLQKKDNELPFKRLQKKVLMEYSDATGREVDDRIADKFIKKLKSAPNVRVDKNRVMLLE